MREIKIRIAKIMDDECGMGVLEVVLIISVLVGLAVLFKSNITSIVSSTLTSLKSQAGKF